MNERAVDINYGVQAGGGRGDGREGGERGGEVGEGQEGGLGGWAGEVSSPFP